MYKDRLREIKEETGEDDDEKINKHGPNVLEAQSLDSS